MQSARGVIKALREHRLIILVILLYLVQLLSFIDKRILYDECWVAVPVYNAETNHNFVVTAVSESGLPTGTYQFTLYQLLLFIIHRFLPDSIVYSRILNIFTVPTILILIYLCSLRIFPNKRRAVIPSLILAVDNVFFLTSYIARPDYLLAIGIPIILLLLYDQNWKFRKKHLFVAGLISGILTGMHPNFILAVIALLTVYLIYEAGNFTFAESLTNLLKFSAGLFFSIVPVIIYTIFVQSKFTHDLLNYFSSFLQKTTTFDQNYSILHPVKLLTEEWRRYDEFLEHYHRIHILILLAASLIYGLTSKIKIIKILALSTISILVLFALFIANKNVRYLAVVLPSVSILIAWMFFDLKTKLSQRWKIVNTLVPVILSVVIISLLAGNIYLIHKRWDTSYADLQEHMQIPGKSGDKILGDLVLWDIYKSSNFTSFMSDVSTLNNQDFDYVITGGRPTIQDETRRYYMETIFPKLKKKLIRQYSNSYYGNFEIYRIVK